MLQGAFAFIDASARRAAEMVHMDALIRCHERITVLTIRCTVQEAAAKAEELVEEEEAKQARSAIGQCKMETMAREAAHRLQE